MEIKKELASQLQLLPAIIKIFASLVAGISAPFAFKRGLDILVAANWILLNDTLSTNHVGGWLFLEGMAMLAASGLLFFAAVAFFPEFNRKQ